MKLWRWLAIFLAAGAAAHLAAAQVSNSRILNAAKEPQNWLTYSGTYLSQRYSALNQIRPENAKELELKWVYQTGSAQKMEATPLVVDGVMYVTQPPNDIVAMNAATGNVFWIYHYAVAPDARVCCGQVNRGLAILGNTLFMGTVDGHLVAIDAKDGHLQWDIVAAEASQGYSITEAPLIVKDKVIVAMAGGELGIRGFVAAYSPETGEQLWKFYTVAGPGDPGADTWAGDSWQRGGGSSWTTGSYDTETNLIIWGTGNPWPDYDPEIRAGDDLYTDSAVAIDADSGKLRWHFQFTPNDNADHDSIQIPVLADISWHGAPRKVVLWANRNGYFYVLDRETGKFLHGSPFVKQTWASGLDANGRPIRAPDAKPSLKGTEIFPGIQGGTNWYSPSFSPRTGLYYVSAWENYSSIYAIQPNANGRITGVLPQTPLPPISRTPINTWTASAGHGEIQAIDPATGEKKWIFKMDDVSDSGVLTTASDLLFTGSREGYFQVLDARNGKLLWKASTGGQMSAGPMTYAVDGEQYVAMASAHALFVWGLRR